jgi:acetyl-CoA synthetase
MTFQTVDEAVSFWLQRYATATVPLGDLLCDAHEGIALEYDGPGGPVSMSYGELRERSMRLAGALQETGAADGAPIAVMLPKSPELLVALVAIWRLGAVHVPLFTAFGPDAVSYRIRHSGARIVITDTANRGKFTEPEPERLDIFCVAGPGDTVVAGDHDFAGAVEQGPSRQGISRSGDDLLILLYTSGTTGQPKGVEVPVRALASIHSYMHYGLNVRPDDVFWNIADPGWGYGLWFAVIGPLLLGRTTLLRAVPFDPADALDAAVDRGVTNLAGAPTVFRSIRAAGVPSRFRAGSQLRVVSSAGEPLNAELLEWSARELGAAIHDHYGQSELGMPVGFAHHPELRRDPVPSSMGFAAPGYRVVVLQDRGGEAAPGVQGELAIDLQASPLYWFRGYFRDPDRTAERFRQGARYYLTGDTARLDEAGLLHFASRGDDVITSSGYRIGPFEIESALMAHPAVAEVAVIGTPDELRGEAVTAFVVTAPGAEDTPELVGELQSFVKSRLAAHLYPRRVVFADVLPRTPSGKIKRGVLREQWRQKTYGVRT